MKRSLFITGISGFLGRNLFDLLIKEKDTKLVLLFLTGEDASFYQKDNVTVVRGNILDETSINTFLNTDRSEVNIVIHIAGRISIFKKGDSLTTKINYEGTKIMVDSSIKNNIDKFIYISSVDSLSRMKGNEEISEQDYYDTNQVEGVYSKSKVLANNYVLDAYKNKGLKSVILCPSAIMGPNDPLLAPINNVIKKFLNGKMPALAKGGYNIVDVRDVASGVLSATFKGRAGESYLLAGTNIDIVDLVNEVAKLKNKKPVKILVPHFLIKLAYPFIYISSKIKCKSPLFTPFSLDCVKQNSNYSKKKSSLELDYKIRDIKTTIIDTVNWMYESDYLEK